MDKIKRIEKMEKIMDKSADIFNELNAVLDKLCENFKISREYGDETARKILIVRNETSVGFLNYIPATIASGISNESIITLKENSNMLAGVHVVSESKRFYPYGEVGAHAIGYLGQISENQKEEYINKKK